MQTIGERLEEARKKKGVSIREAAEATKIRGDYLQKFESNQFDIGLTEIYARGFLRTYASYLKIPVDRVMSDYAALGRGDVRPRQPSREVYGRMDITVASASEAADRAAPAAETPAAEPAPSRPQPHYPRGTGSSLPTGPDPAVVFKWVKIGGAIVGVLIIVFLIKALVTGSGGSRNQPATSAPVTAAQPATAERTFAVLATGPVSVRVARLVAPDNDGEQIWSGTLNVGQRQIVPLPGPVNVWASAGENLKIEINGRQFPAGFTGYGHVQMK
jgi:transcriptional regulator with XRE-family HTH domain